MGWSAGRHVDRPYGGQISPWPVRKVTDEKCKCNFLVIPLSFLSFVFVKWPGKPPKNKDSLSYRTPQIPGKEGKNAQKSKEFLEKWENNKEYQKKKERKERVIPKQLQGVSVIARV